MHILDNISKVRVYVRIVLTCFIFLNNRGIKVLGIIFNGDENKETESFILNYSKLPVLGRVKSHIEINKEIVLSYKNKFEL